MGENRIKKKILTWGTFSWDVLIHLPRSVLNIILEMLPTLQIVLILLHLNEIKWVGCLKVQLQEYSISFFTEWKKSCTVDINPWLCWRKQLQITNRTTEIVSYFNGLQSLLFQQEGIFRHKVLRQSCTRNSTDPCTSFYIPCSQRETTFLAAMKWVNLHDTSYHITRNTSCLVMNTWQTHSPDHPKENSLVSTHFSYNLTL